MEDPAAVADVVPSEASGPAMPGACRVEVERDPSGGVRVSVAGELDRYGAQTLLRALDGRVRRGAPVAFDLRRVSFIDTAAYRTIARISAGHDGPVSMVASSPAIDRMTTLVTGDPARWSWPPIVEP